MSNEPIHARIIEAGELDDNEGGLLSFALMIQFESCEDFTRALNDGGPIIVRWREGVDESGVIDVERCRDSWNFVEFHGNG